MISQSAPVRIEPMPTLIEAEKAGQEEALKVGVRSLGELRAKSADEIQRTMTPGRRFVIDGWYVTEDVSVTIGEGRHNHVDLLIGSNKDEGTFVSSYPSSAFFGLGNESARQFAYSARQRFGSNASAFLELYPAESEEQSKGSAAYVDARRSSVERPRLGYGKCQGWRRPRLLVLLRARAPCPAWAAKLACDTWR